MLSVMVDTLSTAGFPGSAGFGAAGSAARALHVNLPCAVHPFVTFFSLIVVPFATPLESAPSVRLLRHFGLKVKWLVQLR